MLLGSSQQLLSFHCSSYYARLFRWTVWFLLSSPFLLEVAEASGQFQVEIVSIKNVMSDRPNGPCCSGRNAAGHRNPNQTQILSSQSCSDICRPYVRLCFKQFQRNVALNGDCSYGQALSPQLELPFESATRDGPIKINLPFKFSWMKSYSLVIELLDAQFEGSNRNLDRLIEQAVQSEEVGPPDGWRSVVHTGEKAVISYRFRLICDDFFGTPTCAAYCKPRNDYFGHWYCTENKTKVCIDGWTGNDCGKAICAPGCHNGTCVEPGECRCRSGWKGDNCDQCISHVACKNGRCRDKPWECVCDNGWGGPMCDQDLNYCNRHRPCFNHAVCVNVPEPTKYECRCPEGFSGPDCSEARDPCGKFTCQNSGECFNNNGTARCRCALGFRGTACQTNINECEPFPCANGGTCHDEIGFFRCTCADGYFGNNCKIVLPTQTEPPSVTDSVHSAEKVDVILNGTAIGTGNQNALHRPESTTAKPLSDDSSSVFVAIVVSVLLVVLLLALVLVGVLCYRRRRRVRRSLDDVIHGDKYSMPTNNRSLSTKEIPHKDIDQLAMRHNHDNEARLKMLNNVFSETKINMENDLSDRSDSSSSSLKKIKLDHSSQAEPPQVRYGNDPPNVQMVGYDHYKNNKNKANIYNVNKDSKNSYMEGVRGPRNPDTRSAPENLRSFSSPMMGAGDGTIPEDFTVV